MMIAQHNITDINIYENEAICCLQFLNDICEHNAHVKRYLGDKTKRTFWARLLRNLAHNNYALVSETRNYSLYLCISSIIFLY